MYNRICKNRIPAENTSPPPLQANLERQGLPEKTLARLHDLLPQEHVVAPDPGGSDHLHLHLSNITTDASLGLKACYLVPVFCVCQTVRALQEGIKHVHWMCACSGSPIEDVSAR